MSPLTVPCPRQMLFSVRVRESGPEMRGFVEIADPTQSLGGETEPPRCHVASCQKVSSQSSGNIR